MTVVLPRYLSSKMDVLHNGNFITFAPDDLRVFGSTVRKSFEEYYTELWCVRRSGASATWKDWK